MNITITGDDISLIIAIIMASIVMLAFVMKGR